MVTVKAYYMGADVLIAACDTDLIGQKFKEGKMTLKVEASFYGTEEMEDHEFIRVLKTGTIANLTGTKTVTLAQENGFIEPDAVLMIQGIPHAQIVAYSR